MYKNKRMSKNIVLAGVLTTVALLGACQSAEMLITENTTTIYERSGTSIASFESEGSGLLDRGDNLNKKKKPARSTGTEALTGLSEAEINLETKPSSSYEQTDSTTALEERTILPSTTTPPASEVPTVSPLPTATPLPLPTASPQPTATSVPLPTATPMPVPTNTPQPTATPLPTTTPMPTATPEPTATPLPTATPIPAEKLNVAEQYKADVLRYTNEERARNGLAPLAQATADLAAAAQIRANETVSSFSHTRPDGSSCFTVLQEKNINYGWAAENIAYNTASHYSAYDTVQMWMDSPGHRANILNGNLETLGVGYAVYDGMAYVSQLFIG